MQIKTLKLLLITETLPLMKIMKKLKVLLKHLIEDLGIDQWKIFKSRKRGKGWTATTVRGDMYAHYKKVFEDVKSYVPMLPSKVDDFGRGNCVYELIYNNTTLQLRFHNAHTIQRFLKRVLSQLKIMRSKLLRITNTLH